jgi:hypothetical protein
MFCELALEGRLDPRARMGRIDRHRNLGRPLLRHRRRGQPQQGGRCQCNQVPDSHWHLLVISVAMPAQRA